MLIYGMTITDKSREVTFKLHKTAFLMDKLEDKLLQEHLHMTFSQFRVLIGIDHNSAVCQKDIANHWQMTEAAVSRQIDILIEKGLVSREPSEENKSKNILKLTEIGETQLKQAFEIIDGRYEELYQVLSPEEKDVINKALGKLLGQLCDGSETGNCKK
jgi:DNA-binding MarR family transcriptional regulator